MTTSPGQILFFNLPALEDFLQHLGVSHFFLGRKKDDVQIDLGYIRPGRMDGGGPEGRGGGLRHCGGSGDCRGRRQVYGFFSRHLNWWKACRNLRSMMS